jgi:hypothetical protein
MIRLVVEEIKQTLIEQGFDVGDDFDNPENWANLFQEESNDLNLVDDGRKMSALWLIPRA